MSKFTLFTKLPLELRDTIWKLALPDPKSEVCIVWPLGINGYDENDGLSLPLTVDMAWPSLYHVSRGARESVKRSGLLRTRYSPIAKMDVPYRLFDPAVDTLYWSVAQAYAMELFFKKPENAELTRSLRHVAVQIGANYPPSVLAELIRERAVNLQSLAIVVPHSKQSPSIMQRFLPPARRCRLKDIPEDVVQSTTVLEVPFLERECDRKQKLSEFLKSIRHELDRHVLAFHVTGDEGTAWSSEKKSFTGLFIKAQTFVEHKGGKWTEVCSRRTWDLDGVSPEKCIPFEDREDPEEYRVHDDSDFFTK